MNFRYLFIVLICLLIFIPKRSMAQEEIDIDLNSIEDYSNNPSSDFFGDEEGEEDNQAIIAATPRTLQDQTPRRGIYTDGFQYKWYIQAGVGGQILMGEDDNKGPFKDRITIAPSITGGYRWNPIFGVRLNITGGSLHGFNDGHSGTYRFWKGKSEQFKEDFAKANNLKQGTKEIERWDPYWNYKGWTIRQSPTWNGASGDMQQIYFNEQKGAVGYHWIPGTKSSVVSEWNQFYMQHVRYVAANAALTMNLFNLFGEADDTRPFTMSMHLGPTYFHVFPHMGVQAYDGFGINGGIQAQYNINDKFGLYAEFNGSAMPDGFDGHYGGRTFDLLGQGLLGVVYKFPVDMWEMPKLPPRVAVEPTAEVNDELNRIRAELMAEMDQMIDLQPEIDRLRAQLAELQMKPEVVEEVPPEKQSYFYPNPVHFQIGKSDIDAEGWNVIEEVAAYLNQHPDATVIVTGYADKATGTASINERLSRERSKKVADALAYRFNIQQGRIAIDWRGDSVQPFFRNQMNRAVLFYIEFNK